MIFGLVLVLLAPFDVEIVHTLNNTVSMKLTIADWLRCETRETNIQSCIFEVEKTNDLRRIRCMSGCIDQPTTQRLNRSITTTRND